MRRNLIVVGASAGGVNALIELVNRLPPDLGATLLVVQHIGNNPSVLPDLLGRNLPARHALNDTFYLPGQIYVAPPDRHLLVDGDRLRLSTGPRENLTRPAIDPLFRSAAMALGPRVIGVLLTGHLDDGTAGLLAIREQGGITIVQDPADAEAPGMPWHALSFVDVDFRVPLARIPELLQRLTREDVPETAARRTQRSVARMENDMILSRHHGIPALARMGNVSPLTCPSCSGALFALADHGPQRYRCHTGHAFSHVSLIAAQQQSTEDALWIALRSMHEHEVALRDLAEQMAAVDPATAGAAARHALEVELLGQQLHAVIVRLGASDGEAHFPPA